MDLPEY